ncbi:Uma2 family endonuclease [Actinophytocola sp. KF-1]
MSVQPWPDHLLTLEEWDALPEDTSRHYELAEGVLVVAPRPAPHHQRAAGNLMVDLNRQLPPTLAATQDVEVVVESSFPATVRAPDVLVVSESLFRRNPPRVDAAEVLLAVEIISPGTRRTDRVLKAAEYAAAGIPHYWVIDLTEPASITTCTLVGAEYEVTEKATGPVTLSEPATIAVDVSRLIERDYATRAL